MSEEEQSELYIVEVSCDNQEKLTQHSSGTFKKNLRNSIQGWIPFISFSNKFLLAKKSLVFFYNLP